MDRMEEAYWDHARDSTKAGRTLNTPAGRETGPKSYVCSDLMFRMGAFRNTQPRLGPGLHEAFHWLETVTISVPRVKSMDGFVRIRTTRDFRICTALEYSTGIGVSVSKA